MEKLKDLGQGAHGKVTLYQDTQTGSNLVVKVINEQGLQGMGKDLKGQIMEMVLCQALKHPNIVKCYSAKLMNGKRLQITFEYANGGDLYKAVQRKVLNEAEAKVLAKNILSALEYCHELKICHEDIKPENIMIFEDGKDRVYKLGDWGLSSEMDGNHAGPVGTPSYMAPEALKASESNPYFCDKTDLWAFGMVLYFALTGTDIVDGETNIDIMKAIMKLNPETLAKTIQAMEVSDSGKDFLSKLLQLHPKNRPSAKEMLKHPWLAE